ncbi:MAG: [protein-PII] uridylyltransferase [Rhizobiales bacterium]|nr:[protein-PII] uridylyltransferase [Hyphomicrobiales bacterium]
MHTTTARTDEALLPSPPYFDPTRLRAELAALHAEHGEGARPALLERLKYLRRHALAASERRLLADGKGRACAAGLSHFQDELVRLIFDHAATDVYRATNLSSGERIAVAATGGYGRGLLAPGSDIDLLFLLPYKQTAWGETVVEYILYLLWDIGFKVGHATRTVDQCMNAARSDMTIRTSLLDARHVHGEAELFTAFETKFRASLVPGTGREFVEAKLAERDDRHARTGESRYLVEPNVKDGKGGLRDLHTLHWLMKYLHDAEPGEGAVAGGVFSPSEYHAYRRCEDFLWTVRCHLHFLTGRADERLTFDLQPEMATRLGYQGHAGLRSVERFMKHYFLVAKEVGELTRILCAALELRQLKSTPSLGALVRGLGWRSRIKIRRMTDFKVEHGRLTLEDRDVFRRDPVNIIRMFQLAEQHDLLFHPEAIRLVHGSLRLIDDGLRADPVANAIFLKLMTSKAGAEPVLRKMNEAGVLGRFVPEFGRVVAMMQFNMYHHFTVDEHLIRTVGLVSRIERGQLEEDHPLATEIFPHLKNSRLLYVAAFLHDIAKGRKEDHSIAGARIAKSLCPRFGLTDAETDTVAWLIENHLVMSNFAQSRDLADPKTIRDFAEIVQTLERLRLLLVLTVVDIRAVGPGVWTGWKGQLLRQLYYATEPLLAGDSAAPTTVEKVARAEAAFRTALGDLHSDVVEGLIARHHPGYWLRTGREQQIADARLMLEADAAGRTVASHLATDPFAALTSLTIYTQSHPAILALMAGACSSAGADIVSARVYTTRDGMALDTFLISRDLGSDADEERRAGRIVASIEKLLRGETTLARLMKGKRRLAPRLAAFSVAPDVSIDNSLSNAFTVIEVSGRDRLGLLHELTSALSELDLDINSAHVTTFGERVVDVFYVTDLSGRKIVQPARQRSVRERLLEVLSRTGDEVEAAG